MNELLNSLKAELEQFGKANDALHSEHSQRMLNITHETGELLSILVRAMHARRILEIGTSNGYSTLWIAEAANEVGGTVTSVDFSEFKLKLASANFARAGLSSVITMVHENASLVLERFEPDTVDLLFLDSERREYPRWWPHIRRTLRPGGLLVVDNATSHPEQMAPFIALVNADSEFTTSIVPVGNGEFLAVKSFR
jgi:predicted O-methyltransferase YrrM